MIDSLYPAHASWNYKHWQNVWADEMEKYGMFKEFGVKRENFKKDPDFTKCVIAGSDSEEQLLANIGFWPGIAKMHHVVVENPKATKKKWA